MADILQPFLGRDASPLVQFVKYALSGGVATATHITVFHLAAWKLFPALQPGDTFVRVLRLKTAPLDHAVRARHSMIDNGIAFVFSNLVAYALNILWVFERGRHGILVELGLFYLVSGVSIVIGTAVMGYLIRRFGMRTTYAFVANLVSALLINYAMRKFVIFKG
jgi:putative flippase GtrA